jgi:hypothetical protein
MTNSPILSAKDIAFLGLPIKAGGACRQYRAMGAPLSAHVQRTGFTGGRCARPAAEPSQGDPFFVAGDGLMCLTDTNAGLYILQYEGS